MVKDDVADEIINDIPILVSPEDFFQLSLLNDSRVIFIDSNFKTLNYKGTQFIVSTEKFKRWSLMRLLRVSGDSFSEETRKAIQDRIAEGGPT